MEIFRLCKTHCVLWLNLLMSDNRHMKNKDVEPMLSVWDDIQAEHAAAVKEGAE